MDFARRKGIQNASISQVYSGLLHLGFGSRETITRCWLSLSIKNPDYLRFEAKMALIIDIPGTQFWPKNLRFVSYACLHLVPQFHILPENSIVSDSRATDNYLCSKNYGIKRKKLYRLTKNHVGVNNSTHASHTRRIR